MVLAFNWEHSIKVTVTVNNEGKIIIEIDDCFMNTTATHLVQPRCHLLLGLMLVYLIYNLI